MVEVLLFGILFFPQTAAGILAKSRGRNFWFWFFISFLIPVISLVVLLNIEDKNHDKATSYKLAEHLRKSDEE